MAEDAYQMLSSDLVRACDGQLHDGKAARLVGLVSKGRMTEVSELLERLPGPIRVKAERALGVAPAPAVMTGEDGDGTPGGA